jgi:hypothetical protein
MSTLAPGRESSEWVLTRAVGYAGGGAVALGAALGVVAAVAPVASVELAAVAIAVVLGGAHVVATAVRSYDGSRGAAKAAALSPAARNFGGHI